MANPTVTIAGVDRTGKTRVDSVSISRSMSGVSSLNLELIEVLGVYRPVPRNTIIVEHNSVRKFKGYVESVEEQIIPGPREALAYSLSCADMTRLLDWRLYAGSFENVSFYSIVEQIVAAKLGDEGLSLAGVVNPGPTMTERINDGLRPISEWFRKLATATGYQYRIDENDVLHFGPISTSPPNPAPFSLTFTSENWRDLKIQREVGDYRNRQYVRTEYTVSGILTMQFTGDGSTRDFFQFDGSFYGAPTATVDTGSGPVAVTVKRLGHDPLQPNEWYYDVEGWGLHNFAPDAALGLGDILEISYRVKFNNISMAQDGTEILASQAIMGGSGVIEGLHEDRYIDRKSALDARAVALLRQYGTVATVVTFETDTKVEPDSADVEPGQQIDIDLTSGPSDVDDSFLIESVDSQWLRAATGDVWRHRLTCTNLEPFGVRGNQNEPVVEIVERLVELVRIGPDPETIKAESPAEASDVRDWDAEVVDPRDPVEVGTDLSNHKPIDVKEGFAVELVEWFATLKTAPDTSPVGSVEFDILRSTDDGVTWFSIFGDTKPTFAAGVKRIDGTAFEIDYLYRDERLRYDVLEADGLAAVLTVNLVGRVITLNSPE